MIIASMTPVLRRSCRQSEHNVHFSRSVTERIYLMGSTEMNAFVGEGRDFSIRFAITADEPTMSAWAQAEDMGALKGFENTLVAQDASGELLGFCRITIVDNCPYVNPLIVSGKHRKRGIGKALMACALAQWGPLRFVARGWSVPFYRSIGSLNLPWEEIAPEIASDCDGCSLYDSCHPQPMMYGESL